MAGLVALGCAIGCYPDSDKIRNQVAPLPDASPDQAKADTGVPITPDTSPPKTDVGTTVRLDSQLLPVTEDAAILDLAQGPELGLSDIPVRDAMDGFTPDVVDVRVADATADTADRPATDVAIPLDTTKDLGLPEAQHSSDVNPADGGGGVTDRCDAYAKSFCARFQACEPSNFSYQYLTLQTCIDRAKLGCAPYSSLAGSNWPSVDCSRAYTAMACKDFIDGIDPIECLSPGLNADGQACSDESQCQGRRCVFSSGQACGVCAQRSPAGGSCSQDFHCQRGLLCANKVCVSPGVLGATCDTARPCAGSLACSTEGQCVAPAAENAACTETADCDWR